MPNQQDRAERMVDFGMEEANISFAFDQEPNEEEIEETRKMLAGLEEEGEPTTRGE